MYLLLCDIVETEISLSSSGDACPCHGNTKAAIGSSLFTSPLFVNLFPVSHPSPSLTESIGGPCEIMVDRT
ncbi:unnamed protein product [Arabidopsis lyrata]|uniref:Predicted protein n=1 Tax=Arabidopsis lyrata subsp. lyrata TaxID=81972 RepID=D7KKL7_ARALL|nr:predicted protein [Arabidopsis lyrata subsp. lyrata]CAH8251772.1 unnamed protein product [Arabidopsis lyrata]